MSVTRYTTQPARFSAKPSRWKLHQCIVPLSMAARVRTYAYIGKRVFTEEHKHVPGMCSTDASAVGKCSRAKTELRHGDYCSDCKWDFSTFDC